MALKLSVGIGPASRSTTLKRSFGAMPATVGMARCLANATKGAAMVAGLNALGCQAAALGNHDFDFGPKILIERLAQAEYTTLITNLRQKDAFGRPGAVPPWPHTATRLLQTVGGVRLGILGITTPETVHSSRAECLSGLTFLAPQKPLQEEAGQAAGRGGRADCFIGPSRQPLPHLHRSL